MEKINRQLNKNDQMVANQTVEDMKKSILANSTVQDFLTSNQNSLTKNPIDDNLGVLYEFVEQSLSETNIDDRPSLVLNGKSIAVDYQSQESISNIERYQKIFGDFDNQNKQVNLSQLEPTQERKLAANQLVEKIEQLLSSKGNFVKGIYFYGEFGVGKSFLIGVISNVLAEARINNIIVHWPSFIKKLQSQFGQVPNNSDQLIEQLKRTKVLFIDDIGADSLSVWSRDDVLAPILEYRMANQKTTFFTSNFDFKHLESDYLTTTKDTHEPIKAGRLMQRIIYLSDEVLVGGNNRRLN